MTTSSMDIANARREPDITAGIMSGRIISQNARNGPAPRSLAASSSDGSIPARRAFTSIRIYGTQKTVCPIRSVSIPNGRFII